MIESKNKGDCYTCALATLLEKEYEEVPYHDYCKNPVPDKIKEFYDHRDKWLKDNNLISICMPWDISKPFPLFNGDSIRCIADMKGEDETHAVVIEVTTKGDDMSLEIIYDNHMHNAYFEPKDIINLEFVFRRYR